MCRATAHEHADAYARLLLDGAPQRKRPPAINARKRRCTGCVRARLPPSRTTQDRGAHLPDARSHLPRARAVCRGQRGCRGRSIGRPRRQEERGELVAVRRPHIEAESERSPTLRSTPTHLAHSVACWLADAERSPTTVRARIPVPLLGMPILRNWSTDMYTKHISHKHGLLELPTRHAEIQRQSM